MRPRFLTLVASRAVVANASKISLVVGSCLNLINQGEAVWNGSEIDWPRIVLNFAVPYLVASYSAAKALQRSGGG
ncbi:MAG: hypothetical protein GW768_13820 [Sphingomonadales bacterium]|nr:hypothetical protein [Sphingomonadales bacterium]NCT05006.1 hypothetical protein [Sphingomonadales bacterium]